ncbi:MAG: hypothetical protein JWO48_458 [Bryobacterales bacterium]|nr:hypothetical protein [Bryobacterales bacterium]
MALRYRTARFRPAGFTIVASFTLARPPFSWFSCGPQAHEQLRYIGKNVVYQLIQ